LFCRVLSCTSSLAKKPVVVVSTDALSVSNSSSLHQQQQEKHEEHSIIPFQENRDTKSNDSERKKGQVSF